jgi:penicillin amidase
LEELAPHSFATFQQIHGDNYDGSAAEIMPFLIDLEIDDPVLAEARDWLAEWDFQMYMDSAHAPLYAYFWARLMDNLYNDQFAGVYRSNGNSNHWWATYLLMQDPDNAWWDDSSTDDVVETRDDILLRSFEEAYAATVEALGEDRDQWRWGTLHTTTFVSNPLGESGIGPVEAIVNRGPVAVSGTGDAVNAMGWSASGDFTSGAGPSERAVYDLSDWGNSRSMHPTGQSGHPISEHYDDMIEPWRHIEYHVMLWSREQVEEVAVSTLILTPGE